LFHLDNGRRLLLHLMLGGLLYLGSSEDRPERTTQIEITFGPDLVLYFMGLRLGYLHILSAKEAEEVLAHLGPEPLGRRMNEERFISLLQNRRSSLKTALVNQDIIAGIGNCYADEIAFAAGLRPSAKLQNFDAADFSRLYHAMCEVLVKATEAGGYMEMPVIKGDTLTGGSNDICEVYDRGGETCSRCGDQIVKYSTARVVSMIDEIKVGGHFSIRYGYSGAAKTALQMGAGAFQYFPKNPRGLSVKSFDARDAETCRQLCLTNHIVSVAHTPYPSNLAADPGNGDGLFQRVVESLRNDLEIAEACGSVGIVVHFGTNKAGNPLQSYQNIIQCINKVLANWQGQAKLLIENQAGDHGDMGMTLEEMVQIRKLCDSPQQIGFCLDTCHAFAAGMWMGEEDDEFATKAQRLGYWEALSVVHLNDSRYPLHSRKDRHARVGQGYIGESGFRRLLQMDAIRHVPFILETAAGADGTYREDMELIRRWAES
jgi:deoxyribonuclease-4